MGCPYGASFSNEKESVKQKDKLVNFGHTNRCRAVIAILNFNFIR